MIEQKEHTKDIMIALLPVVSDWTNVELPHLTLVYAGEVKDRKPEDLTQMLQEASHLAVLNSRITSFVTGIEVFGPEDDQVDVLTLRATPEIRAMRGFLEKWNMSEFREYRPHVTIGKHPSMISGRPMYIAFNRIMVAWGDDQYVFNLTG